MTNSPPPATTPHSPTPPNPTSSPTTPPPVLETPPTTQSRLETALAERETLAELAGRIAGPDPIVETYLDKAGRLNMARLQAAEMLRPEPTTPDPEPVFPTDDLDPPLPPDLPGDLSHPLHVDADQMSDQDYRQALDRWRQTQEYQTPARAYQQWLETRRS